MSRPYSVILLSWRWAFSWWLWLILFKGDLDGRIVLKIHLAAPRLPAARNNLDYQRATRNAANARVALRICSGGYFKVFVFGPHDHVSTTHRLGVALACHRYA